MIRVFSTRFSRRNQKSEPHFEILTFEKDALPGGHPVEHRDDPDKGPKTRTAYSPT